MPYDGELADRVAAALAGAADVREQQMFGGVAFMVGVHMAVGVVGNELMVRLGEEGTDAALDEPSVRPMDFTGRPAAVASDDALAAWVERARRYVATLPARI